MSGDNEFSRLLTVEPLPDAGLDFRIEAADAERRAVMERLGLLALDRLQAHGRIVRSRLAGGIEVEGRLHASLAQACVVTLEPVPAEIDQEFRRILVREDRKPAGPVELDPLADEAEPLEGTVLDIGEMAVEELAVALDPYPHAPGAESVEGGADDADEATGRHPFAALAGLRRH